MPLPRVNNGCAIKFERYAGAIAHILKVVFDVMDLALSKMISARRSERLIWCISQLVNGWTAISERRLLDTDTLSLAVQRSQANRNHGRRSYPGCPQRGVS